MKYTKGEAVKACKLFLNNLARANNSEDLLDDGSDSEDYIQNENFNSALSSVNESYSFFANMDIEGVSNTEINNIWDKAWMSTWTDVKGEKHEYKMDSLLPESKYNHNINMARAIIDKFGN